jgi:succinoglycan biosynthesis transport protein ExoP
LSSTPLDPFASSTAAEPAAESDFNVAEYFGMVRRHWRLVAAFCLTTLVAAGIHFAITPKQFAAAATVQIERRSGTPVFGTDQNPLVENYWDMEYYPTQYKLLESRGLAERVVRNLDLQNDPSFNPGAALVRAREAKKPTADDDEAILGRLADRLRGGLTVEPVRSTQLVTISYISSNPEFAARAVNGFAEAFIDMGIENRFASAGKASSFLGAQINSLKQEIEDKEKQLQSFSRKSDIVTLDPSSNVLLQRLEALNQDYMAAKKMRIEREARYNEVLASPKETVADTLSGGMVSGMRTDQLKMESEYETKLKTYKPDWPAMVSLRAEIEKGRQHIASVVEEMVAKAKGSAYAEYQTAQRQEGALQAEVNGMKREALDQSSSAVEYGNLKVEVETRRTLLNELLKKQSETEVAARLQDTRDSNVHIIDRALMPGGPFRPSLRQDLIYGLLLGLLLGIGSALLIEFLDRTIKTPEEIERRLALPTLAVVPDLSDSGRGYGYLARYGYGGEPAEGAARGARAGRGAGILPRKAGKAVPALLEKKGGTGEVTQIELVPHERPRTPISEAYRSLRTALLLSSADEIKVVAITSAEASEGKTATAANLAVVLAQLGRQVLVVDCDLRKPRMHQVFKLSNRVGLVNQLTGGVDPREMYLPTEVPNLYLTPSGTIPPNPSELLASDRMREWLKLARGRFDYVIIDTPPALAVTDATVVGTLADGVVLTLASGKVTREEARACRDRLKMADIKILGAVLNRYRSTQGSLGRRYRYYESYGSYEQERAGSAA